ncbi:MAG: hypothetical protein JWR21_4437 [Herminiimonas sp.]|nr:hypothetical protein [Herminiimonas sp.]
MATIAKSHYENFTAFYPVYLGEHSNRVCRQLHFAGSTLALLSLVLLAVTGNPWWLLAGILCGYAFAWTGHFAFERTSRRRSNTRSIPSWVTGSCIGRC